MLKERENIELDLIQEKLYTQLDEIEPYHSTASRSINREEELARDKHETVNRWREGVSPYLRSYVESDKGAGNSIREDE